MSYGLAIWSSSGVARVYDTSWIPRFHSRVTLSVRAGQTVDHSIPGLNPSTWGVIVTSISSIEISSISLHSGFIRLSARSVRNSPTFTVGFIILEA